MVSFMKKILFLIHDLSHGGAEKVLVNLVNNMDREQFDITVMALFGGGINEQFLAPHIRLQRVFPRPFRGNSHLMKLLSPRALHRLFIRERYDMEISYLEGPSARIISGCPDPETKLVSWIHSTAHSEKDIARGFRAFREAVRCFRRFHRVVFVSAGVKKAFARFCPPEGKAQILYNTNDSEDILLRSREEVESGLFPEGELCWCGVGKLVSSKGFDRMVRIQKRLREDGLPARLYILGEGPLREELEKQAKTLGIRDSVIFLGYQTNPYKYAARCSLFACASHAEGFSTAATEALIVGTPVCTVEVSGMKEMLGENNEWGIVTENDEEALYRGIRELFDDPKLLAHYQEKAAQRGKMFSTENTVNAVEEMLLKL